jgi:ribosome-associated protein
LFERVIVASGTSNRQTKALAASVRDAVRQAGFDKPRVEGEDNGEWIIVDCGAAVAHIMQPLIRQYYHLEELWGDKPIRLKPATAPKARSGASKPQEPDPAVARKAAPRKAAAKAADKAADKTAGKTAGKTTEKPAIKSPAKSPSKPSTKPSTKSSKKPAPAAAPAVAKTPAKRAAKASTIAPKKAAGKVAPRAVAVKKSVATKAPAKSSRGT